MEMEGCVEDEVEEIDESRELPPGGGGARWRIGPDDDALEVDGVPARRNS